MRDWLKDKTGTLLARVTEKIAAAAKQPGEDNIHELRTSMRRLREALRVFGEFYRSKETEPVRKSLRELMHLAAEIRNRDIALELLHSSGVSGARLRAALEKQRDENRTRIVDALDKLLAESDTDEWQTVLSNPRQSIRSSTWHAKRDADENAALVLPELGAAYWKAGRKMLRKHLDFETLHRFRLQTKRYRYTLELFRGIDVEPPVDKELARLKPVQDLLGSINDCATALDLIGGSSGRHAKFAQYLHERAAKKIARLGSVLEEAV